MVLNVLAVLWLAFETVNITWPRASLAPVGAPWYQVWAAPMVVAAITVIGLIYLAVGEAPWPLISPSSTRASGRSIRRGRSRAPSRCARGRSSPSATTSSDECDARTEVIDARGAALIPGLTDSHLHPFWGAELARGVDLSRERTQEDVLAALAAGEPERGWLFAWGLDYDAAPTPAEIARRRSAAPRRSSGSRTCTRRSPRRARWSSRR